MGLRLYRDGRYWDSHEAWEDLWRPCRGPERHVLQALIQLDAALLQAERGRWNGVWTLLSRCQTHLQQAGNPYPLLREQVARCQADVERVRAQLTGTIDWTVKPNLDEFFGASTRPGSTDPPPSQPGADR